MVSLDRVAQNPDQSRWPSSHDGAIGTGRLFFYGLLYLSFLSASGEVNAHIFPNLDTQFAATPFLEAATQRRAMTRAAGLRNECHYSLAQL